MIGRCVANRPYMYLPLKGDTNDYSVNAQNPSNTGVVTTTGIFGESNGAYDWDTDTDKLTWSNTIGQTIVSKINTASTIMFFINGASLSENYKLIFGQYDTVGGDRSFVFTNQNYTGAENKFVAYKDSTAIAWTKTNNSSINPGTWQMATFTTKDNTSNLDCKSYVDAVINENTTYSYLAVTTSTDNLSIGASMSNNRGAFGKMTNFRFYDVVLSNGALNILNNEKGRIRS